MKYKNWKVILLVFTISNIAYNIAIITQGIDILLRKFLVDDSYYYYVLSRNIMQGNGVVFNSGIPTNGFHPLWASILVAVFSLFYPFGINSPVYVSLLLITLLNIGTSVFLFLIVRKTVSERAGLLAAFIWLYNPFILFKSFSGVGDVVLQTFILSGLTYYLLNRNFRSFSITEICIIGFGSGLVFLSRMDGVFFVGGIYLAMLLRRRIWDYSVRQLVSENIDVFYMMLISLFTVLPWLLWGIIGVGRFTPVSGAALRLDTEITTQFVISQAISVLGQTKAFVFPIDTPTIIALLIGPGLVLSLFSAIMIWDRQKIWQLICELDFIILGSVPYFGFYTLFQGWRMYYHMHLGLLLTIFISSALIILIDKLNRLSYRTIMTLIVSIILLVSFASGGIIQYQEDAQAQHLTKMEAANYIDSQLQNCTVASFDTGILQYYTPNHDVINLDGVINPEAYEARRNNNINSYILQSDIDYIVNSENTIEKYGLENIAIRTKQFHTESKADDYLWKIDATNTTTNRTQGVASQKNRMC